MVEKFNLKTFFGTSQANCLGVDVRMFYPSVGRVKGYKYHSPSEAIAICNDCSVKQECLDYSLHFEPLGVWGGKTETEREVLRRSKNIVLPIDRPLSNYSRRATRTGMIDRKVRRIVSVSDE